MQSSDNSINLTDVVSRFKISGSSGDILPFGSGHINSTFRIKNADPAYPDYLLQKINHYVFKDVPALTQNIQYVTAHLKARLLQGGVADVDSRVLTLIPATDGNYFYKAEDGSYWRVYLFVKNTKSYDVLTTATQAYEGGRAFGNFQLLLNEIDAAKLSAVIPDFHNIKFRLRQLDEAIDADVCKRVSETVEQLAFVDARREKMQKIQTAADDGKLPLRVTHNDTKFNNVLLDQHDQAQCIIDLDTVMPGCIAFDFGDAVRTIINTREEDEPELSKIELNVPFYEAFTKGFLEETRTILAPGEVESLYDSVFLLPYIMGVRFLTDHLKGDVYYKIAFAGHNLQRAKAQFRLIEKLEEAALHIKDVIYKYAALPKA